MLNWICFVYSAVRACITTKAAIDESLCDILVDEKPNLNIIHFFFWIAATSTALFLLPFLLRIFYIERTASFLKAIASVDNHLLGSYLPPTKKNKYNLRKKQYALDPQG